VSLFDWPDPTRGWPDVDGAAPDPSWGSLQLASLPFGSPVEAASVLGRPDKVEWRNRLRKDCDLLYARKGLRLRFAHGRLREVTYLVGADACRHPSFQPSRPLTPDGSRLTPDADRDRIASLFGEPDPGGSDETVLQVFHGHGVISDFSLDDSGHLKEWSLYPDD
jgi:hypothetical protein